jgi:hypothetical protein
VRAHTWFDGEHGAGRHVTATRHSRTIVHVHAEIV